MTINNDNYDSKKFMLVSVWIKREFAEGSRPQNRTVIGWVADGSIIGSSIVTGKNKRTYIRCDQRFGAINEVGNAVNELIKLSA